MSSVLQQTYGDILHFEDKRELDVFKGEVKGILSSYVSGAWAFVTLDQLEVAANKYVSDQVWKKNITITEAIEPFYKYTTWNDTNIRIQIKGLSPFIGGSLIQGTQVSTAELIDSIQVYGRYHLNKVLDPIVTVDSTAVNIDRMTGLISSKTIDTDSTIRLYCGIPQYTFGFRSSFIPIFNHMVYDSVHDLYLAIYPVVVSTDPDGIDYRLTIFADSNHPEPTLQAAGLLSSDKQ